MTHQDNWAVVEVKTPVFWHRLVLTVWPAAETHAHKLRRPLESITLFSFITRSRETPFDGGIGFKEYIE